jgi:hypothetical protein
MRRYYLSSHSSGSRPAHNLSAKGDRRSGLNRWKWVGGNSSFIREGIDLMLRQEDEQPTGWSAGIGHRREARRKDISLRRRADATLVICIR